MKNNFCYIHIPFCESKCRYCKFASFWNIDSKKIELYMVQLMKEIKSSHATPLLKGGGNFLKSIYFGWWTPSILESEQIWKIVSTINSITNFDDNMEISLEINPQYISLEKLKEYKRIWINRLSLWIQTLNDKSLKEIWRSSKFSIFETFDKIKKIWFQNVSIDFIIWLPNVKVWETKKDIEYILNKYSFIKHISVYMLEDQYYPWNWKQISISEDEFLEEYTNIKKYLETKWFYSYEISNFAKKGFECKHNKAYWNHDNVYWFWLWAHSFVNNTRFSNSDKFVKYYSFEREVEEKLSEEDLFIENVMFRLRTDWLNKELYMKLNISKIEYFIEKKYLEKKSDRIILSDKGVLVLDYILKEIL